MLEETIEDEAAPSTGLSRKATLLMAELLQTANRVLPLSIAAKIQVRGSLDSVASDMTDALHRHYLGCLTWRQIISKACIGLLALLPFRLLIATTETVYDCSPQLPRTLRVQGESTALRT